MAAFLLLVFILFRINEAAKKRYNVLFVVVDDLRTELGGPYGQVFDLLNLHQSW